MKTLKIKFAILIIATFTATAFPHPQSINQFNIPESSRPLKNGFIFLLAKGNKTSFLIGTIHAGISEDQRIGKNILDAASHSSRIFFEANIFDPPQSRQLMVNFGTNRPHKNLRAIIGGTYYDFFKNMFVEKYKLLKEDEFDSSKPWFLAMLIPVADGTKEVYMKPEFGTEVQLFDFSRDKNIPINELEGLAAQVIILDSMSQRDEGPYFNDYVDLIQERVLYHWQLKEITSWTNQNIEGIQEVLNSMDARRSAYTDFYLSHMIKQRNISLAKKISNIASLEDRCLFAIGSEHLTGASNVIEQLRSFGYSVTPMQ